MPFYVLKDTRTDTEEDVLMTWDSLQEHLAQNPHLKLVPQAPAIVSGTGRVMSRTDEGFKDVLRNIKSKHRGNKIDI
jgi:hypothetical protein